VGVRVLFELSSQVFRNGKRVVMRDGDRHLIRVRDISLLKKVPPIGNIVVELGRGTKDGGIDLVATKDVFGIGLVQSIWQAKKRQKGNPVDVDVVKLLDYTHIHYGASKGVIVTTTSLTRGAMKLIEQKRYLLHKADGNDLDVWIRTGRQP
jgi:hypothetical protein